MPPAASPAPASQASLLPPRKGARGVDRRFAAGRSIVALVLREMSTRYGRSPGGYAWAIIEPMGAIFIMAIGFSLLLRSPSLGNSFILFYATGFLPFTLYMSLSNAVSQAIAFSKPLLFYPAVTWLDAVLARFVLNTLTGVLVSYLLFVAILVTIDSQVVLEMGPIVLAMGLATLMGLGVGLMNCALMGLFPTYRLVWSIFTRPLFLASGVLFLYEDLGRGVQDILWWNPLMHVTGLMRRGFYATYTATYVSPVYVLAVAFVCIAGGLLLMGRYHRQILNS